MSLNVKLNNGDKICIGTPKGKMLGIMSISTSKYDNPNCQKMMQSSKENICKHCFVDRSVKMYPDFKPSLERNHKALTTRLLTKDDILKFETFKNVKYVRFEAFGDLCNVTHLENYVNIARQYKDTNFALWTKHFKILLEYFKSGKKFPKNLLLVLSSPYLNKELPTPFVDLIKKYNKNTITFTVVNDKKNPNINCGKRRCIDCLNCYKSGKRKDVIELIK